MKKIFAFAIAAVTMTVGCQKIQELVNPDRNQTQIENDDPVEIQFTTNVATVDTKAGQGALEDLSANQTLYIYGLNRSNPTKRPITNAPAQVVVAQGEIGSGTPNANIKWLDESLALDEGIAYFYNGTNDYYDFYGYYVDDAAGDNPEPDANYQLAVTIDGQHDILLAKAEGEPVYDGGDPAKLLYTTYSAKSARDEVIPNLEFKHQLSQFIFNVRNHGNSDITLTKVEVETLTKGTLTVAEVSRGETKQGLTPTPSTDGSLTLPMTTTKLLPAKPSNSENSWVELDGSVMVFPAQDSYDIKLTLTQTGVDGERVVKVPFKYASGIAAGSAYTLQITVYSLTEAGITASLAKWTKVTVDEIDTEDYEGVDDGDGTSQTPQTPSTFTISEETKSVAATEETFTITVTPVATETVTVNIPAEATWITKVSTENSHQFTVAANTGEERSAIITFTDDATTPNTKTLTVTQAAGNN